MIRLPWQASTTPREQHRRTGRISAIHIPGYVDRTHPAFGFDGGDITSASMHPEKIAARSDRIETPLAAVESLTANRAMQPRDQCGHFSC